MVPQRFICSVVFAVLMSLIGTTAQGQSGSSRVLAPGVLTVIPTEAHAGETAQPPRPLVEVTEGIPGLEWTPNYLAPSETLLEMSRNVVLRRSAGKETWNLEFAFKPLRMVRVDIPQPDGRLENKLVWYMVYRVRYTGRELQPSPQESEFGDVTYPDVTEVNYKSRRFFPHFVLEGYDVGRKAYLDQIIPAARRQIVARERVGQPLHNSVEITQVPIPLTDEDEDRGVWGFVTWTDVDPRIDFFSIFVQGLSNAYTFEDPPGLFQAGDPPGTGRIIRQKTLRLNFWRPGDSVLEHEDEIRFGLPIELDPSEQLEVLAHYGLQERLDFDWVYR
jgi:hypothetical protein